MDIKFANINNRKIYYKVAGHGTPIILLHGFGEDGTIWKWQEEELAKHSKIIIPDLPGSGKSEMIEDMSIEGMAACTYQLLLMEQNNNTEQVIIIGHSMGGYIALAFAEKYCAMLKGLGLVHSTAFADNIEKISTRQRSITFIKDNGSYEFLKQSIPTLFTEAYKSIHTEVINNMIEQHKNFSPQALIAYYKAMIERPDRTEVLKKLDKPILFIIGKHDKAISFEDSMQQCHLPQFSYINVLENSAHMGMWEETTKCNTALLLFLKMHSKMLQQDV